MKKNNNLSPLLEDNLITYYWMGFILADGHFEKDRRLKIELSDKDYEHLQKLANFLSTNIKSFLRNTNFKNNHKAIRIECRDYKLIPQITKKFDIFSNKTTNPPKIESYPISNKHFIALLIGLIDGDGCIFSLKRKTSNKRISIRMHYSWNRNLIFLVNILNEYFGSSISLKNKNNVNVNLIICNQKLIYDLLYFAKENNIPIMNRKWSLL